MEVAYEDKQDPDFAVLPRYWVEAREVHLRAAKLPQGLLAALRDGNVNRIALALCHLMFLDWLHRGSGGSVDRAIANVFTSWTDFASHHPFAREIAPTQMGLCGNRPACIAPPGPSYLPAEAISTIDAGPRSRTVWYSIDPTALRGSFSDWVPYAESLASVPSLRSADEASTFAYELLSSTSSRWLMGWRGVTNGTNERTVVGGVFPISAVGNSLPVWTTDSDHTVLLPALLSSFACYLGVGLTLIRHAARLQGNATTLSGTVTS